MRELALIGPHIEATMSIEQRIKAVATKHGVSVSYVWYAQPNQPITFKTDGLPILPFFLDLATEFGVPIENITAYGADVTTGCPTCGGADLNGINWELEDIMSIYRYAGATLMLAGLIDASNRKIHMWSREAASCERCRVRHRDAMFWWLSTQA